MPSFFSRLWDFPLFEKMVLRLLLCLQYLCPLLLGSFRYYFFFILYYSLISVENFKFSVENLNYSLISVEIPSVIRCLNS